MTLEFMTLLCDICKERPMKTTQKIQGEWKGVCSECEQKKENNNENAKRN
jgi:hypothetical protein